MTRSEYAHDARRADLRNPGRRVSDTGPHLII